MAFSSTLAIALVIVLAGLGEVRGQTPLQGGVSTGPLSGGATGDEFDSGQGSEEPAPGGGPMYGNGQFGRDPECGGTDRAYYNQLYHATGIVMSLPEMARHASSEFYRCGACGSDKAICWPRPETPDMSGGIRQSPEPPAEPGPMPQEGGIRLPSGVVCHVDLGPMLTARGNVVERYDQCVAQAPSSHAPLTAGTEIDNWCQLWDGLARRLLASEQAHQTRLFNEERRNFEATQWSNASAYPPTLPGLFCAFEVTVLRDGSIGVDHIRTVTGGERCEVLRGRIAREAMPPFPTRVAQPSVVLRPSFEFNRGRSYQTRSQECIATFESK